MRIEWIANLSNCYSEMSKTPYSLQRCYSCYTTYQENLHKNWLLSSWCGKHRFCRCQGWLTSDVDVMNTAMDLGAQANLSRSSLYNSPANLKGIGLHGYGSHVSQFLF